MRGTGILAGLNAGGTREKITKDPRAYSLRCSTCFASLRIAMTGVPPSSRISAHVTNKTLTRASSHRT